MNGRGVETAMAAASYEAAKAAWIARNPDAAPAKYEAAMRRIARKCGL